MILKNEVREPRWKKKRIVAAWMLLIGSTVATAQVPFPYSLPSTVTAALNVDTSEKSLFNNRLLGVNNSFQAQPLVSFVQNMNPTTVRFPIGVFSNVYDWRTDKLSVPDGYPTMSAISNNIQVYPNAQWGFPKLESLQKATNCDILWTYNLNYDSNESSVARMIDSRQRGLPVNNIELGNEQFWKDQRSYRIDTPEKYYNVAKSLSAALKARHGGLSVSIPISWNRGLPGQSFDHRSYNAAITKTKSYYDALSVHRYIHNGRPTREEPNKIPSPADYRAVLNARLLMDSDVGYCRQVGGKNRVWLSEFGVSAGDRAVSFLGMADLYLYLAENQGIYEMAHWFQIDGTNELYEFGNYTVKTGYGAAFEIVSESLRNSTLLGSNVITHQLEPGAGAVSARAVYKGGKMVVLAVNKTPENVPFTIRVDNVNNSKPFVHRALKFTHLGENKMFPYDDGNAPLSVVKSGSGQILLPPYSINKIDL